MQGHNFVSDRSLNLIQSGSNTTRLAVSCLLCEPGEIFSPDLLSLFFVCLIYEHIFLRPLLYWFINSWSDTGYLLTSDHCKRHTIVSGYDKDRSNYNYVEL